MLTEEPVLGLCTFFAKSALQLVRIGAGEKLGILLGYYPTPILTQMRVVGTGRKLASVSRYSTRAKSID